MRKIPVVRLLRTHATPIVLLILTCVIAVALPLTLNPQTRAVGPDVLPGQSVTILPNGEWLLLGGKSAGEVLSNALTWDPATGKSDTLSAKLQQPRAWHTATVLPDGTILILGGVGSSQEIVQSSEVYNPDTKDFSVLALDGLTARARHTATLLTDGRVLIAGGIGANGEALATGDLWDSSSGSVSHSPPLRIERHSHSAVLTPDGEVLIWGGVDGNGNSIHDGESYKSSTNQFAPVASYPSYVFPLPTDAPTLEASLPIDRSVDVPTDAVISFRFSKPLKLERVSTETVTLTGPAGIEKIKVVAAENGLLVFVTPASQLIAGAVYSVTINGGSDRDGLLLPTSGITFTTVASSSNTQLPGLTVLTPESAAKSDGGQLQSKIVAASYDDGWEWIGRLKEGKPHSDWQDLPALQAESGVTALSGQALDLKGNPLVDVTLTVEYGSGEISGRTDESGRFLLQNISAGWRELIIDGRRAHNVQSEVKNSKWGYGVFEYGLEIKGGQTNTLPFTIWLTRIDHENAVKIGSPTSSEVVVTTPKVAGLELRIPGDTTIRDHEGKAVHEVTLTRIPVDRTPFPLAKNVDVPVYFTAQPGGAYLYGSEGARVVYPNYVNEKPGARFNFWRYTTEPSGWYIYGHGSVSRDGKQVIPDQGARIYEFSGAMFETGLSPAGTAPCIGSACKKGADPVDLGTGLFVLEKTDLYLPDVIPLNLTRTYRQSDSNTRAFGIGMMHTYSIFAFSANQYQEADLVLPDSGRVHYIRTSPGNGFLDAVFEHRGPDAACPTCVGTPTSFYGSRMVYNGNGWDLTLKDGTVYVFGENQPLQAIRDRYGNQVTITRTNGQAGNIVRVTSPNGRWIEFTYDTNSPVNRIIEAKDNMGRSVGYEYDFDGRLFRVTDTGGGITEYTYDASHRMLTIKDARGIVYLTNEYDPATGRVTKQTQIDGGIYQFAYTTDANGKVTRTDVTDPRGNIRRLDFNPSAYSSSETFALGKPEEQVSTSEIQPGSNLLVSQIDALGRKTTFTYDAKGNVQSITRLAETADAVTANYTYEPTYNQVATVTDPLSHTTTFGRDSQGNLASITNALNEATTFTYNAAGQPISTTDPLNHATLFTYTFGDLTTITDPLGNLTAKFTDQVGRVLNVVNPLGQQSGEEYDSLDRLTKMTDALNHQTQFGYDQNGNLLNVTDARSNGTVYTYNNMDRIAKRQDPLLRTESYQYDLNGNLIQFTDRKNQLSLYTYDAVNRRSSVTYTGGSTTAYTYDKGNRLTEVNDSIAGLITRTYDGLDRLKSETTPQGSVAYTYDAAGRRATMTVSGQAPVVYSYDNANRLTQITQGSSTVGYAYDTAGRRTSLTLPNGVLVEYGYDAASRLTSITYKQNGNTVLGDLTYEYDKNGNRTNVGGSFARSGIPQSISAASYNAANQQTAFGDKTLTYDNNGNLQTMADSSGLTTYSWNSRNQLVGISGPGVNASFVYDGLGRREKKIINGNLTEFLFDGANPVQETSGAPVVANMLTGLGIDEFLTRTDNSSGATSTFLSDALGSSVALTDSTGGVQTEYTYDPFGRVVTTGALNASSYQYTGRENDGIGLDYYRARYYDPTLQRFISEDPIGFEGGDPNLYAYVSNNPTNYVDPDGNLVQTPVVIGVLCASGAFSGRFQPLWAKEHCERLP